MSAQLRLILDEMIAGSPRLLTILELRARSRTTPRTGARRAGASADTLNPRPLRLARGSRKGPGDAC